MKEKCLDVNVVVVTVVEMVEMMAASKGEMWVVAMVLWSDIQPVVVWVFLTGHERAVK